MWDERKEEFIYPKPISISLEHSLVSVSKWEAKWHRSFLADPPKTRAEWIDYVKCMTITQNVPSEAYFGLTDGHFRRIERYMAEPMTATTINSATQQKKNRGRTVTSELIYCWMVQLGIPFECQKWHLNRLLTLIRVCNEKNAPKKNMSQKEIAERNRILNEQRKAKYGSRG